MLNTNAKTHLAHGIERTEYQAKYDESVKELLSDKQVLAWIAKYRIAEFQECDIETIMTCIEGEPEVSSVSVYHGKKPTDAITGMNSESKKIDEGEVTFDVRFYMVTPDREHIKVIVNIEAQKSYYPGYAFEPRAIVYCSRMISEQIDREFTTDNYDGLKKVYSIWIFFDAPQKDSDTITEYSIKKQDVHGAPVKGGNYDYLSISFIRLPKGNTKDSKNKLIDMLSVLFSEKLDADSKKKELEQKYQMKMTRSLEGGIHTMCNVGSGIWEKAMTEGRAKGRAEALVVLIETMRSYGADDEEIIAKLVENMNFSVEEARNYLSEQF